MLVVDFVVGIRVEYHVHAAVIFGAAGAHKGQDGSGQDFPYRKKRFHIHKDYCSLMNGCRYSPIRSSQV